jgi:hypothetical protein
MDLLAKPDPKVKKKDFLGRLYEQALARANEKRRDAERRRPKGR